jgi:tetratricopeptide (TPR) repeat protein
MRQTIWLGLLLGALTIQRSLPAQTPEATSLFGAPLVSAPPTGEQKTRLEADLAKAQADYERDPSSADAAIWLGRRLGYLGRFRDAIDAYTKGIARHPNEPRLYRHRGHRYITIRQFDLAIADLRRAAQLVAGKPDEIEPDGAPNRAGIPRSTLQSNIWYHLGLAYYLSGDFSKALDAYREGIKVSRVNDDMLVATSDWLYMTLRRLGRDAEAKAVLEPIREQMDIIENGAYHARLLMYKGLRTPESVLNLNTADDVQIATQGYGVGNWYLVNGDHAKAKEVFDRVLSGRAWTAFGFIAAEADVKRGAFSVGDFAFLSRLR